MDIGSAVSWVLDKTMGDKIEWSGPDGGTDAGVRQLDNQKAAVGPRSIEEKNENSVEVGGESKRQGGGDGSDETGWPAAPSAELQGKHVQLRPVAAGTGAGGSAYGRTGVNPPSQVERELSVDQAWIVDRA